jgi:hypothetical protein
MKYEWNQNVANTITFVMIDAAGVEVPGLGAGFTIELRKPAGAFVVGGGAKSEISDGWYQYISTAGEADTLGLVSILVNGAGCIQQNLLALVALPSTIFPAGAIEFTYTVTDTVTLLPIEGVEVWISTDNPAVNIVWKGDTDAFGVAMDVNGNKPKLDAGTYYFWRQRAGYTFTDPDTEIVS